jgi:hypothetical protein
VTTSWSIPNSPPDGPQVQSCGPFAFSRVRSGEFVCFTLRRLFNPCILKIPMTLPLKKTYRPMEAQPAADLPSGPEWQYEPKWDGFRCLALRDGKQVDLISKSQKPLTRYFPELVAPLAALKAQRFLLDKDCTMRQVERENRSALDLL